MVSLLSSCCGLVDLCAGSFFILEKENFTRTIGSVLFVRNIDYSVAMRNGLLALLIGFCGALFSGRHCYSVTSRVEDFFCYVFEM